jgi:DNA-binding response OmpR family regulator
VATVIGMSSSTVFLVGVEDLGRIPGFLALGAVVVVVPDDEALRRWHAQASADAPAPPAGRDGLVVDLEARRVLWDGRQMPVSDLEFRLLSAMGSALGRAFSFAELRRIGWGHARGQGIDLFAVRSAIQRLRRRLAAAGVPLEIQSVRSYGFRLERSEADTHAGGALSAVP